jgi:hypothetical protein
MASGSTAIAAVAPRKPWPRWSDRVVLFRAGRRRLGRPPVCSDQSGRTSAPINPHAVQTMRGHKDRTKSLARQPVGIHDGAVVAPARGAVNE